jgi:hypothetical protein
VFIKRVTLFYQNIARSKAAAAKMQLHFGIATVLQQIKLPKNMEN